MREHPGQLTFSDAQGASCGPLAPSAPPGHGQPSTKAQNAAYTAARLAVTACSDCGHELTAADIGQNRRACTGCRRRREQDRAAERTFAAGLTGKPGRCRCLRWVFSVNGDELGYRCGKCGRRHA